MIRAVLCRARVGTFVARQLVANKSTVNKLEFYGGEFSSAVGTSERNSNKELVGTEQDDQYLDEQKVDEDAMRLIESLRKLDDAVPFLGSGLVKNPTKKVRFLDRFKSYQRVISAIRRRNGIS